MKYRRRARNHDERLRLRRESGSFNGDAVLAKWDRVEVELAIGAGVSRQFVGRIGGLQRGARGVDRLMLRVVDDAADVTKDGGSDGREEAHCQADGKPSRSETTKRPAQSQSGCCRQHEHLHKRTAAVRGTENGYNGSTNGPSRAAPCHLCN